MALGNPTAAFHTENRGLSVLGGDQCECSIVVEAIAISRGVHCQVPTLAIVATVSIASHGDGGFHLVRSQHSFRSLLCSLLFCLGDQLGIFFSLLLSFRSLLRSLLFCFRSLLHGLFFCLCSLLRSLLLCLRSLLHSLFLCLRSLFLCLRSL